MLSGVQGSGLQNNIEQIIKAAADNKPLPEKPLPKDLLKRVTGGDEMIAAGGWCPVCGVDLVFDKYPGGWELYCPVCNILYDASWILDW